MQMQKMSQLILAVAERALAKPTEKSSREAVAAALLLAPVAWNRALDPRGGAQVGYYRKLLTALEAENPKCLGELKSTNWEALIQELVNVKKTSCPGDTGSSDCAASRRRITCLWNGTTGASRGRTEDCRVIWRT